jgi:hypothetical protein
MIFDDYRNVRGVKLPFKEDVYQNGAWTYYQWQDIELNPEIDDAIFNEDRPPKQPEGE